MQEVNGYILFVNLDKATAKPEHKFNDFFNGDFEWDSQPRQHMTKAIVDVVNGVRQVHLMTRVLPKIKSKSQPLSTVVGWLSRTMIRGPLGQST